MSIKLITTVLFGLLFSNAVFADYDARALQKLFTDKQQRSNIDALRSGQSHTEETQKKTEAVKVTGYVKRSDGRSVVWINGKNTLDQARIDNIKVRQADIGKNKKVGVIVDGRHVHLRPGETWYDDTGKIVENQ